MTQTHARILQKLADEASFLCQRLIASDPTCPVSGYFQGRSLGLRLPEQVPCLSLWLASEHHSRVAAAEADPWTREYFQGLAEGLCEAAFLLARS